MVRFFEPEPGSGSFAEILGQFVCNFEIFIELDLMFVAMTERQLR